MNGLGNGNFMVSVEYLNIAGSKILFSGKLLFWDKNT